MSNLNNTKIGEELATHQEGTPGTLVSQIKSLVSVSFLPSCSQKNHCFFGHKYVCRKKSPVAKICSLKNHMWSNICSGKNHLRLKCAAKNTT